MSNMLAVKIKHAGKSYDVEIDLSQPGSAFKDQIERLTGVPAQKVKIPVKGGMLRDDADVSKLGLKQGQTLMVIGAAEQLPAAPEKPVVFLEDMSDVQLAKAAVNDPVGLVNLGNTCYLNSTVQVLRAIPQFNDALVSYQGSSSADGTAALTASLRDLFKSMSQTTEGFPPFVFLQTLRQYAPQFAEMSRSGQGYAQQDAQEAWGAILQAVRNNLHSSKDQQSFVDQYLTGQLEKTLESQEAKDEPKSVSREKFLELRCNISSTTNYLAAGISESLVTEIEKTSPSLGRTAVYKETSKVDRLPQFLTVNLVRFYYRRDINKKTKIMRKVKFPFDYDVMDLLSDQLKRKIAPVNEELKTIDKDRRERAKIRRRAKNASAAVAAAAAAKSNGKKAEHDDDDPPVPEAGSSMQVDDNDSGATQEQAEAVAKAGELVDEPTQRRQEIERLEKLVDPSLRQDTGCNFTGMYELVGVVTHKGASADGGHYVGWVRKESKSDKEKETEDPDKQEWYRFDDDKVTTVTREKIQALEGGGEDHAAYILLYASKNLD